MPQRSDAEAASASAHADVRDAELAEAAASLGTGGLVAFPTETVYGLGADSTQPEAVARIFEAKGRPRFNPLIAHVAEPETARAHAAFDSRADALAAAFWPGPLTLVLPRTPGCGVAELASAGLPTLAVRVPGHPVAQRLLHALARPVVAPSANASGQLSPTTAEHVRHSLGARVDMILDGGPCTVGVESTILDLTRTPAVILRHGGISREALTGILGEVAEGPAAAAAQPNAPGQLASHYAPVRPLRLNARTVRSDEALLAFGADEPAGAAVARNLSPAGDLREAAANLFAHLHALDSAGVAGIAVVPVPEHGLGAAINDRLRRAAAPRPASSGAK